ncbi:MAG: hypothetical protein ACYCZO_00555 [Daejeonella sp.]
MGKRMIDASSRTKIRDLPWTRRSSRRIVNLNEPLNKRKGLEVIEIGALIGRSRIALEGRPGRIAIIF